MAARIAVGIVALACVSICGVIATFANLEMVDKVNASLSKKDQFDALGWYFSKTQRLHREYKKLYPAGRLLLKLRVLMALMIGCLLIAVWGFEIFGT
jgi:hypothetical protein